MVIKIPKRHTFPESLKKKIVDKTSCSLPEWEISVSRKDDIAWSVVLSYLMSTNYKDGEDFQRRLSLLTGNYANKKSVKKSIKCFNPFRNRYACFYDEVLKTVIKDFKKHMNWSNLLNIDDKLSAVSKILGCPIVLIRDYKDTQNIKIFSIECEKSDDLIILLAFNFADSENENSKITVFNFLISSQKGLKLRKAALVYFLKEAKLPKKEIKKLVSIDDSKDSFLIALLKSNHRNIVKKLYQSPYILSKLSDATYDMDPRTKDSEGLSALYYALIFSSSDNYTLHTLYNFALNNCYEYEDSYRNLDSKIVSNLCCMEELLSSDMLTLETLRNHPMYQVFKIKFSHLIRFNKFLMEVGSKICKVKSMMNYYESTKENIFEAGKRRDVIVVLLEAYNKFFHWVEDDIPMKIHLKDYISNRNYYNLIDIVTAVLFFDNIVFLKERLRLENDKQFSKIESCFFISIIYYVLFEQAKILETAKTMIPEPYIDLDSLYIFPLIKRVDTLEKINAFNTILRETDINEDNVIKKIPENVIYSTLCSYRVLKDSIELERLKKYMKIGVNVKLTDVKSVLAIERVLQVIGECIESAEKEFSFKRLLSLCLPKEISRELRSLRNDLTHLKGHLFPSKIECEKNLSLFRSIQSEMRQIESYFQLVYRIVHLDVAMYTFQQLEDELQSAKDSIQRYTTICMIPLDLLQLVMLYLKKQSCIFLQRHMSACQMFLTIALQNLVNEVKAEFKTSVNATSIDVKEKIVNILKPLKWLLELLQKYGMDNSVKIIETYEKLENSNNLCEIEEVANTFLRECADFIPEHRNKRNRKKFNQLKKSLKSIKYIKYFKGILNGCVYLSDEEKDEIRKEIPQKFKESALVRNELIESIKNDSYLDIEANPSKFELIHLSVSKNKQFRDFYNCRDSYALTMLESPDPIDELEGIFSDNSVDQKKYLRLCEKMQFTEKTRKKLSKLIAGQRKKNPFNNLSNLLNRVKLLKQILVEENEEVYKLWNKIKSQKSRQLIHIKILDCYLKNDRVRAAAEMLLFDCMGRFKEEKFSENPWIKSSKLYSGIDLRNVISHGSPLLESICSMLDPQDLPSEIIKKMILLIQGTDAMEAILELYEQVDEDYTKCLEVINFEGKDTYNELRNRIISCDEWRTYTVFLPHKPKNITDRQLKEPMSETV